MLECDDDPEDAPRSNSEREKVSLQHCDSAVVFAGKLPNSARFISKKEKRSEEPLRFVSRVIMLNK